MDNHRKRGHLGMKTCLYDGDKTNHKHGGFWDQQNTEIEKPFWVTVVWYLNIYDKV